MISTCYGVSLYPPRFIPSFPIDFLPISKGEKDLPAYQYEIFSVQADHRQELSSFLDELRNEGVMLSNCGGPQFSIVVDFQQH